MSPRHVLSSGRFLNALFIAIMAVGAAVLLALGPNLAPGAPPVAASGAGSSGNALPQVEPTTVPSAGSVTELFLPLVAQQAEPQSAVSGEEAPPPLMAASSGHSGNSLVSPPPAARQTFVADTGGDLDRYLPRAALVDGRLKFTVHIAAPIVKDSEFIDAGGWLTDAGLQQMKSERKLSDYSVLQLQVYDVDEDAAFCAQVDHVWINGRRLEQGGIPAVLRGSNDTWNTWTVLVPTQMLRFPVHSDDNAQTGQPAPNEIAIEVDTRQCLFSSWALEVDWGAVTVLPGLNYGLFFVHGWTGNEGTFEAFQNFAERDGYTVYSTVNYSDGIDTLAAHA
jgi:hypothetical protein